MDYPVVPFDGKSMLYKVLLLVGSLLLIIGMINVVNFNTFFIDSESSLHWFQEDAQIDLYENPDTDRKISIAETEYRVPWDAEMSSYIPIEFNYYFPLPFYSQVYNSDGDSLKPLHVSNLTLITHIYREDGLLLDTIKFQGEEERSSHQWSIDRSELLDGQKTEVTIAIDYYVEYIANDTRYVEFSKSNGIEWEGQGEEVNPVFSDTPDFKGHSLVLTNKIYNQPAFLVTSIVLSYLVALVLYKRIDHEDLHRSEKIEGKITHGHFYAPWKRKVD